MSHEKERQQHPILPSIIENSFDMTPDVREFVDRVGNAMVSIRDMLEYDGVEQEVRGETLIVGRSRVEVTDSRGNVYYARAFEVNRNEVDGSVTKEWGILYDQTPSHEEVVANPTLLRIRQQYGFNPDIVLLPATDSGAGAIMNDPEVAAHIFELTPQLVKAAKATQRKELVRLESEKQQRAAAERNEKWQKQLASERRWGRVKRTVAVAGVLGMAGASVYGLAQVPWSEITDTDAENFDEHEYAIEDPAQPITLGEQGVHPLFSDELYERESEELGYLDIPTMAGGEDSVTETSQLTTDEATSLRQVVITSSKEGKNCEVVALNDRLPLNAELLLWTDFANPDGSPRNEELDVSLSNEALAVCWNGEERNDDDDPRVVFELRD